MQLIVIFYTLFIPVSSLSDTDTTRLAILFGFGLTPIVGMIISFYLLYDYYNTYGLSISVYSLFVIGMFLYHIGINILIINENFLVSRKKTV